MSSKDNRHYNVSRQKEYSSGLCAMPMSNGPPKVVRLHGPIEINHVPFDMATTNAMPDIPSPNLPDMTLLGGVISVGVPSYNGASAVYAVSGNYRFVRETNATPLDADMDAGMCPTDNGILEPAKISKKFFVSLLG